jgi:two-component system, LytTR family, response regulator
VPLAIERTNSYALRLTCLNLVSLFESGWDVLTILNELKLIFLNINMDEVSGIQLLENMKI